MLTNLFWFLFLTDDAVMELPYPAFAFLTGQLLDMSSVLG